MKKDAAVKNDNDVSDSDGVVVKKLFKRRRRDDSDGSVDIDSEIEDQIQHIKEMSLND